MPTKIWPFSFSIGPIVAQISRSRSVRPTFSGRPPTCMFDRVSPSAGTRLIAPDRLAVDEDHPLVALATAGRNFCTISGSRLKPVKSSCSDDRLRSFASSRNTPAPPLP